MEKKKQRKLLAATDEDDEQQQQQEEPQQHQKKRQKGDKKIRQQEARRLKDATLAERQISALQQALNPQPNGAQEEQEAAEAHTVFPEQQDTDDEQQEAQIHRKTKTEKQQKTQSLAAFSSSSLPAALNAKPYTLEHREPQRALSLHFACRAFSPSGGFLTLRR